MTAAGASGMAVALTKVLPGSAQNGVVCQRTVQALTSAGPSFGQAYSGVLEITMGDDGAIDTGSFTPDGGISAPVVGESEGRALSLRVTFSDGQALVLSGTGENEIETCSGALSGIFSGPQLGDTGSWVIDPAESVRSGAGGSNTSTTAVANGTATATATPACPGVECDSTYVVDPATCECVCPDPYEACGPVCCPAGSECMDEASGQCACPEYTELCGDSCVEYCPMQMHRDVDTCACVEGCDITSCPEGEDLDPDKCLCVSVCPPANPYYCGGSCYAELQVLCSGVCYPATSVNSNPLMCGSSCQVCPTGVPCIGGSCQCPATYSYCAGVGCKSLSDDNSNCGSCGTVCTGGKTCQGGMCQS
jgi:hypothetical protein